MTANKASAQFNSLLAILFFGLASASLAQTPSATREPAAATKSSPGPTRVITLGTQGGPVPGYRAQPANAVVVGGRIYLVDAGNGVMRQITAAGLDFRRVAHIFITHNHDDHNADWGTLMGLQLSIGVPQLADVYGPFGTESMLQGFLQYYAPNDRIRRADARMPRPSLEKFHAHDITHGGLIYQDELVKVSAVEVCHYHFDPAAAAELQDKAFAYRFQTPDKVIVFSGDTGACASMTDFARDADLLIHEVVSPPLVAEQLRSFMGPAVANTPFYAAVMRHMAEDHTAPEDIGKLANAAHVKKVVLSHLVPGRESDPDSAYVDGVKKFYAGPVVVAKDLMEF